jgi:pSer/pThr/pTyr-binding forkhead associated (FHA) protein
VIAYAHTAYHRDQRLKARRTIGQMALIVSLLLAALAQPAAPVAWAQGGARLQITRVDATAAPDITVDVTVENAAGNRLGGLQPTNFQLTENGKPVALTALTPQKAGMQLAIVIDASGAINKPGLTGQTRIDETREALQNLLLQGNQLDATKRADWVSVLVQQPQDFQVLTADSLYPQGWTNDYQLAYNKIYQYDATALKGPTQPINALLAAIRNMSSLPAGAATPGMPHAIIFFSDGANIAARSQLQDLVAAATAADVTIHTVELNKPEYSAAGEADMQQIALLTRGVYTQYTGLASLDSLFQSLAAARQHYQLKYHMGAGGNHYLQVRAAVNTGGETAEGSISFTDSLAAPTAVLTAPAPATVLEQSPADDNPTLPIALSITWPGGKPHKLAEVVYAVDEMRYTVTQEPFERFNLPSKTLAPGPHVVHAEVTDEFGLRARTPDVALTVRSVQPLTVNIVNPPAGAMISRGSVALAADPALAEPRTVMVQMDWQSTDGRARAVKVAECLIDAIPYPADVTQAGATCVWDISHLSSGVHILQARVTDELGLTSESRQISVTVQTAAAGLVPATLMPALVIALAGVAFILAVVLLIRKREAVGNVGRAVGNTIRAATQPFHPDSLGRRKTSAGAFLIVEEGDDSYPEPIALLSDNTRIGRDDSLVNLYFEEVTVSRLHCRVAKEQDGSYRVYDEGSTSGTYVNYQRVPMMGQLLQTDDIIQIGRIRLRFRRTTETAAAPADHEAPESKAAANNGRRLVESRNRTGRTDDERHRHSQIRTEPVRPVAPARSKSAHAPSETESDPFDTETWRDQPELREDGEDDAIKTQPYRPN